MTTSPDSNSMKENKKGTPNESDNPTNDIIIIKKNGTRKTLSFSDRLDKFQRGTTRLEHKDENDFPIRLTRPEFDRPTTKFTSRHWGRLLTWDLTKSHTEDLQNNLILIERFLNKTLNRTRETEFFHGTISNGRLNLKSRNGKIYSLTLDQRIDPNDFLETIKKRF